jgi:hypothetical protein
VVSAPGANGVVGVGNVRPAKSWPAAAWELAGRSMTACFSAVLACGRGATVRLGAAGAAGLMDLVSRFFFGEGGPGRLLTLPRLFTCKQSCNA